MGYVTKKKIEPSKKIFCKTCFRKTKVYHRSLCAFIKKCERCANLDVEWTLE